jgi:hypothetical protein
MYRTNRGLSVWMSVALGIIAAHPATPPLLASDKPAPAVDRDAQRPSATRASLEPAAREEAVFLLSQIALATAGEPAGTTSLNVSVQSGGSNSIAAAPGGLVHYQVMGLLSDDNNKGLALVGFDLDFDGGDLSQADNPTGDPNSGCENPMIHFTEPWGITNPAGFGGTVIHGDLIQVGGAQNTTNNTQPPAPIGTVLLRVAQPSGCGPAVLVTGALTAPSVLGSYTLALENLFANVIRPDATGVPIWQTQAAGVGTVANLTILVGNVPEPEGACCLPSDGGCAMLTAAACGASGGAYGGDDSTCGADHDADGVADACDACPESNMADTIVINECDSGVENRLLADGCTMLDAIDKCAAGTSRYLKFVRCVVALVDQWQTDTLITGREGSRIVRCTAAITK